MKKIFFLSFILFLCHKLNAQCDVTTSASAMTITCGQSVSLSAFGQSTGTVILNETFNSGGFGPGWGSTPGATNFSNPCSPGGVDGTPHAWMDNNTSVPRALVSTSYNLSSATAGVTICFDMLFAEQGNSAPCEGPDEPDEGVFLQYSINGGATWIDITYFDPNGGNDPMLTNWNNWCFPIPAAAITSGTLFRWFQSADSGADYDHWGIDNVQIYQNDINSNLVWLHDGYSYGTGNPGGVNPTPVSPTTTTTYTAQLTTGTGATCTQSITITVLPPVFDVNITATPNPICLGDCANITATAQEVLSPASTPTFENNELDVVTSGSASVNINVQGLNMTSLTNGSITQVVINGFTFSGSSFCGTPGGCPCGTGTVPFLGTCTLNPGSFTVTLTSPTGCTIILAPAGLAGGGYSNTVFVPVGGTALGGGFPTGGPWNPSQPFSNLNGCNPNGVWTLSFNAPGVGFGVGTLSGWSITFDDPAIYGPVTYVWSPTTNMTGSTTLTPTVCPTVTTTYNLTVSNPTPGCASYTEGVTVTVNNCACTPPTVTITPPVAVCAPGTVNLASAVSGVGTSIITYHANAADANADTNPLGSSIVSTSGTYHVRVEDPTNNLCFSVQTITVVINPAPVVSILPLAPTICPGSSTPLTASGATTYSWAPATGLSATTGASVTATPAVTTTYTVTGTSAGCTATSTVTVTVANNLVVSVTPSSATICPGGNVSLTASGATTYVWAAAAGLSSTSGATVTASPATTTTYTVTGTTGTCTADTTVTITVSNNLIVDVTPSSATICPGGNVSLTASGATTYAWAAAAGLSSTSGATVTASPAATTTYTVTGTSGAGCTGDTTVTITVSNNLIVDVTPSSATICPGGNVSLTASGATTYAWAAAAGLSSTSGATVTASPATTTTYTVTGTSGAGCTGDTTVTVTVAGNLIVSVTPSSATICPGGNVSLTASGATTYAWAAAAGLSSTSGATVTASPATTTTYTVTGTSGAGCTGDTTVTVTVASNLIVSVTPSSATICPGDSVSLTASGATTYAWAAATGLSNTSAATVNASPATTTTYTVTGTSGAGCTGDTTVTVTVANSLIVSVTPSSATICPGNSVSLTASGAGTYAWAAAAGLSSVSGATVSASPAATTTYTVTGTSGTCTADTTVTITVSPAVVLSIVPGSATICPGDSVSIAASGASTYVWAAAAGLSSTSTATVNASPAVTTTYTVTGTSAGCTDDTTITVTVANNLIVSVTPSSATICPGDSVSLTASGAATYTWASASGLSSTTAASVNASPAVTTTYTVTGTSGAGCTGDTTVTVTVAPAMVISVVPPNATICAGSSVTLTANGATTYAWANAAGLNTTSGATVSASPATTTTYTVTGTTGTCTADTTITVTVTPMPVLVAAASPGTICIGSSSNLTASGASSYLWAPSATLNSSTDSSVIATPAGTTVYTVIGINGTCTSTANVTVIVIPLATANAGLNDTICFGESTQLLGSGGDSYYWAPPFSVADPTSPSTTAAPFTTTTYTLTVTNGGLCNSIDSVTIFVNPLPYVNAGPDATINIGETVELQGSGYDTLMWIDPSETLTCFNCPNPIASPIGNIMYVLTSSDTNHCFNSDTVYIEVTQEYALYVPNAFTPNGDLGNSTFYAKGYGIEEINMMIFNRWGEKIFETNKFGEGWDGTFKGNIVEQEVYVYKIIAKPYVGNKIQRIGSVTVVR